MNEFPIDARAQPPSIHISHGGPGPPGPTTGAVCARQWGTHPALGVHFGHWYAPAVAGRTVRLLRP